MALPILDGNQSATTLSSILTSGEHIPAHTVVSLGTQAITDISGAVSGSVVSISNFPATQTIAGTVTANLSSGTTANPIYNYILEGDNDIVIGNTNPLPISGTVTANLDANSPIIASQVETGIASYAEDLANAPFPISGTVTVGNSVTIGSLPAISGTVTANVPILDTNSGSNVVFSENEGIFPDYGLQVGFVDNLDYRLAGSSHPFPISGTVTVGSLPAISGTVTANVGSILGFNEIYLADADNDTRFSSSYPFPISGTVTIGNSVTIASFATSVTARLINPAGTAVTYAEVGTAGSPSIDVLSVQGVTSGTPVITTLLLSSTAITSGSFTSLASATLVPGNTARKMATVYNLGAGQLFVNAGATATTLGGGFMVALSSGDFYECDYTTTTLSAIFATAGTASWMSH